ncbi:hypothetical protein ACQP1P_38800 [Dactylosporangium sp. CA-052675]|uniref:hypothetical protein n=1 Tax=Dactylosporangium sp. CA-052675 TaxID=3239927 RepID=UPI003D90D748
MSTPIGTVIQPGESIPEDVTRVRDRADDTWEPEGFSWICTRYRGEVGMHGTSAGGGTLSAAWGPLTVTAVREQPAEPARKCPGCGGQPHVGLSCIDAGHVRPLVEDEKHAAPDLLDLVRQYGATAHKDGYFGASARPLFARIEAEVQRLRDELAAVQAEPEPEPEGGLLDLIGAGVRRLIGERDTWIEQHRQRGVEIEKYKAGADSYRQQRDEALAEVARLKAAAPGRTEQARDGNGYPLFIHACGHVSPGPTPGVAEGEHYCFPACPKPGAWRPLLVATDAPQQDGPAPERIAQAHDFNGVPLWIHLCGEVEAFRNVPLDEPPFGDGCDRCDSGYPQPGDWRPLLAEPSLRPPGPAKAQQDGPVVLTLPEVPEGAVALTGGTRWVRSPYLPDAWVLDGGSVPHMLGAVLDREGSVTVEMAPPREPRTWPKLDEAPGGEPQLRGASGTVYRYSHYTEGVPVYRACDETTGELVGRSYSFYVLQHLDGPLTEVFDAEAGTR